MPPFTVVFFIPSRPPQPQARQASPSISTSPTGRWMRWCPTCLGEPKRTEASWGEPRRRGICCGRSWNADLPLGSFSTDQRTENTEEETKRRGCQCVEIFFFFFFFFHLPCLTAAAVAVCCVSPGVLISCSSLSWRFLFADGPFRGVTLFFSVVFFSLFCSPSIFSSMNCSCTLYYFPLSTSASISIPHVVFPFVYRALVSIKWASLLLQKDSLKCQRDRGGRLILSPYLSWRGDNNNKNNRLDLNGSKGNINIFASYGILWCRVRGCTAGLKMIPVYESMRKV